MFALAVTLSACQPAVHAFRYDAATTDEQKTWVNEAIGEVNAHFGCEAIHIDPAAVNTVAFSADPTDGGVRILGDFDPNTGDVLLINFLAHPEYTNKPKTATVRLAVHEFGHALGKEDHSPLSYDLMFFQGVDIADSITDFVWSLYVKEVREAGDPCDH